MNAHDIRRKNLEGLAREHGRQTLAEKLGYSDTNYLNQVLTGHVQVGPRAPRKWERLLGLSNGWFDVDHSAGVREPDALYELNARLTDPEVRAKAARILAAYSRDHGLPLPPHLPSGK